MADINSVSISPSSYFEYNVNNSGKIINIIPVLSTPLTGAESITMSVSLTLKNKDTQSSVSSSVYYLRLTASTTTGSIDLTPLFAGLGIREKTVSGASTVLGVTYNLTLPVIEVSCKVKDVLKTTEKTASVDISFIRLGSKSKKSLSRDFFVMDYPISPIIVSDKTEKGEYEYYHSSPPLYIAHRPSGTTPGNVNLDTSEIKTYIDGFVPFCSINAALPSQVYAVKLDGWGFKNDGNMFLNFDTRLVGSSTKNKHRFTYKSIAPSASNVIIKWLNIYGGVSYIEFKKRGQIKRSFTPVGAYQDKNLAYQRRGVEAGKTYRLSKNASTKEMLLKIEGALLSNRAQIIDMSLTGNFFVPCQLSGEIDTSDTDQGDVFIEAVITPEITSYDNANIDL